MPCELRFLGVAFAAMWKSEFRSLIKQEFERLKSTDFDFTMNQFAKMAGVSSGTMSEILNNRREWALSEKLACKIAERIPMSETSRNKVYILLGRNPSISKTIADESKYAFLTCWKHRAVLMALDLPEQQRSQEHLCQSFGLTEDDLKNIFDLGLQCGVLELNSSGQVTSKKLFWNIQDTIPGEVIRKHHIENMDRIRQAIQELPSQKRDCTSVSFVGNKAKLDLVRKEIRAFYDRVSSIMNDGDENDEVFQMSVSLIPLSQDQ